MKYYAVTEDPNELFHYGVKGMKWGQHLFGKDLRPKSAAYKRAASKLRSSMKSGARSVSSAARAAKNTIQKGAMQIAYNNRARQDRKYQKAILKAQRSTSLTQALSNLDKENRFKKQVDLDRKREAIADKLTSIKDYNDYKSMKKSVKAEKKMPKYLQEAREGTLKYGKLSEEQIGRVQDRLALEASTRRLGSTEAPKFKKRMKMAVQEGLLQGTTRGIATGMEEVAKAKVQNKMKNRRQLDKQNENRARREHEAQRIRNDRSHAEIREDLKREAYISDLEAGKGGIRRALGQRTAATAARRLEANKDADREKRERLEDARQLRLQEARDNLNDARDARKRERERQEVLRDLDEQAKFANDYDMLMPGSDGGKNGKKGGNGGSKYTVEELQKYYRAKNGLPDSNRTDSRTRNENFDWDSASEEQARNFARERENAISEMASEKRNAKNRETLQQHAERINAAGQRYTRNYYLNNPTVKKASERATAINRPLTDDDIKKLYERAMHVQKMNEAHTKAEARREQLRKDAVAEASRKAIEEYREKERRRQQQRRVTGK